MKTKLLVNYLDNGFVVADKDGRGIVIPVVEYSALLAVAKAASVNCEHIAHYPELSKALASLSAIRNKK